MLTHTLPLVWQAERAAEEGGALPALWQLRRLGLAEFGDVMLALPRAELPALSRVLPRMPPEAVQRGYNGDSGISLMHDSVSFVRTLVDAYRDIRGHRLRGRRVLDFGFGWGRLLRLMAYYTDPELIAGVDTMEQSVLLCREHGVLARVAQSAQLPRDLPVGDDLFDLIYSYSVFTHLSLRSMDACLAALHAVTAEGCMLAVTVRPIEYWDVLERHGDPDAAGLRQQHLQNGFAYRPHNQSPVEGDLPYGDSSVDITWFAQRYAQWELRGVDRGYDVHQTVLLLTAR